jgi:flavin reductase (DIM6/NTAB) family NADH-FMN oxidoreductase RutF
MPMDTAIDSKEFRRAVGHFVTGVTVIAIDVDGDTRGMTANAFTSLSLDPPLVLFCVAKKAHLGQLIGAATGFSVNILALDQQPLSQFFSGGWKDPAPPPFAFEPWQGGPKLAGSVAAIGCGVETIHEGGDHYIVIGRVVALHRPEPAAAPLVFSAGRYAALADPTTTA